MVPAGMDPFSAACHSVRGTRICNLPARHLAQRRERREFKPTTSHSETQSLPHLFRGFLQLQLFPGPISHVTDQASHGRTRNQPACSSASGPSELTKDSPPGTSVGPSVLIAVDVLEIGTCSGRRNPAEERHLRMFLILFPRRLLADAT